jgi:hypothetical protein
MEKGQRFAIREGGRTIGAGRISEVFLIELFELWRRRRENAPSPCVLVQTGSNVA